MLEKLAKREKDGNMRMLRTIPPLIDFASNDYLGLARSEQLAQNILQELSKTSCAGFGSTGSRLFTGNSQYSEELEKSIADFHGYESGLLYSCGYMANIGLLPTVSSQRDVILYDTHIHASTLEGIRLSQSRAYPFKHCDLDHLERRLKNCHNKGERFICVESIYSTDGVKADLKSICMLAERYNAKLIVDEAHATGVCGLKGKGLIAENQFQKNVFAHVVTFGKALGVHGAIVLGSNVLKQLLVNFSRSFIYTTALPHCSLTAIQCSYHLFPKLDAERAHLRKLGERFRQNSHIQSLRIDGNKAVRQLADSLTDHGYHVSALISPTVKRGNEALRINLHAFNTLDEVDNLQSIICALETIRDT